MCRVVRASRQIKALAESGTGEALKVEPERVQKMKMKEYNERTRKRNSIKEVIKKHIADK